MSIEVVLTKESEKLFALPLCISTKLWFMVEPALLF